MAERKAVNKYYPPEWTPNKGSINQFVGSHPLRERAKKINQGILVIRFEMPYNIWCDGCGNHIGMGVRYNAEKSKVGMYYTTPIYKFRMKCHLCSSHFEMQTDPQNLDYTILCGARRQERRWDPDDNEQVAPEAKEVTRQLSTDAMFRLEHGAEDKQKRRRSAPALQELAALQGSRWKDDYAANQALRKAFRDKKTELSAQEERSQSLKSRSSLQGFPLLAESLEDKRLAQLLRLLPAQTFEQDQKERREKLLSQPLFASSILETTPRKQVTLLQEKDVSSLPLVVLRRNSPQAKQKVGLPPLLVSAEYGSDSE